MIQTIQDRVASLQRAASGSALNRAAGPPSQPLDIMPSSDVAGHDELRGQRWGSLVCHGAAGAGRSLECVGMEALVIGRGESCDLRYANDASISSRHCMLYIDIDDP